MVERLRYPAALTCPRRGHFSLPRSPTVAFPPLLRRPPSGEDRFRGRDGPVRQSVQLLFPDQVERESVKFDAQERGRELSCVRLKLGDDLLQLGGHGHDPGVYDRLNARGSVRSVGDARTRDAAPCAQR